MNAAVRVCDLPDNIGQPLQLPRPLLLCPNCGAEFSAERGDYFRNDPTTVLKHCRRNLRLVTRRTVYEDVKA